MISIKCYDMSPKLYFMRSIKYLTSYDIHEMFPIKDFFEIFFRFSRFEWAMRIENLFNIFLKQCFLFLQGESKKNILFLVFKI